MPAPEFMALIEREPWWLQWARERLDAAEYVREYRQSEDNRKSRVAEKRKSMSLSLSPPKR
jgi:hypothetical protein